MKIKLYVNSSDPYCGMVENLLKYHNIEYERIEVSPAEEKLKELEEISGQNTVPVLVVDEKVFVGFDHEQIKKVLNLGQNDEPAA